ncbi:MAG: hypothetical protein ABIQ16_25820, partial [Polyangiaceae bacterium]
MSHTNQSSKRILNRTYWAALAPILLLAPLALAAKGCDSAIIGDDCPEGTTCTGTAGSGNDTAGRGNDTAGRGNDTAGRGNDTAGTGNGTAGSSSTAGSANNGGNTGSGARCGGLQGLTCVKGEYCVFPN